MSSVVGGARIYTGPWVDWSKGGVVRGSTITLSPRSGALLTAFLAFFVTIVGACLWRVISYTIHQISATPDAKDGMHHQHQLILRNTSSPAQAARAFAENAWSWRKNGTRAWVRSLPLAAFALLFMLGFGAASILTSLVTKSAGSARLIVSDNCGYWAIDSATSTESSRALTSKTLSDTVTAAAYARTCYGPNASSSDEIECALYTTKSIDWVTDKAAKCPFADAICSTPAYQLDTQLMDSHHDFGINAPTTDRIALRKVTTCAVLKQDGYVTVTTSNGTSVGASGDRIRNYNYGSWVNTSFDVPNATFQYNQHSFVDNWGYQLDAIQHTAGSSDLAWEPIEALQRTDADVSIIFLAGNAIKFYEPNGDPLFSANFEVPLTVLGTDQTYYLSDNWVSAMGCTDQYQICSSSSSSSSSPTSCTVLSGWYDTLNLTTTIGLNTKQQAVADRVALSLRTLGMYHSIGGRGAAALRAQETVSELSQFPIPDAQWRIEIDAWFATALARLQRSIVTFAAGLDVAVAGAHIEPPTTSSRAMCTAQKVRLASSTTSFSTLGVALIIGVGGVVVLLNLLLAPVTRVLQREKNSFRRLRWVMDDKVQLQRMAYEEAGMGDWSGLTSCYPVT